MWSRFYLRCFLVFGLLASSQLNLALVDEVEDNAMKAVQYLLSILPIFFEALSSHNMIVFNGNFDLRPEIQRSLLENTSIPSYTVGSNFEGKHNPRIVISENLVIVLFAGLDDPILSVVGQVAVYYMKKFILFTYAPPTDVVRPFAYESIWELFKWCSKYGFDRALIIFQGETGFENWSYLRLANMTVQRVDLTDKRNNVLQMMQRYDHPFVVQVVNDHPIVFWYNSSEQADVTRGGNISISGTIGIMVVEFMRYLNATMDILVVKGHQDFEYQIVQNYDRPVDIVANLVANDSMSFLPIITDSQICLVVPIHRIFPASRVFDKVATPTCHYITFSWSVLVIMIKYFSHPRRSLIDALFSTFRFNLALPLPGGQLHRLPLADRIIEVLSLFGVGIVNSSLLTILTSALTTGLYYPMISDVESMRASGLRIVSSDPTILEIFKDNRLPSSLMDLLYFVDDDTIFSLLTELNDSYAYVVRSSNWRNFQLYQQRLGKARFRIAENELCTKSRQVVVPMTPSLQDLFRDYFYRVSSAGLLHQWNLMGFHKFWTVMGIQQLPTDDKDDWKPLPLEFYKLYLIIYISGISLAILVFIIELLLKRYRK